MSKAIYGIYLAAILASVLAVAACSGGESAAEETPLVEATPVPSPQATAVPTATAQPTPTATPAPNPTPGIDERRSESPGRIAPLDPDDPHAFYADLTTEEQACLAGNNLGIAEIESAMTSTDASRESDAILDCLSTETVLRLFLSEPLAATGELSDETSACLRDGLGDMDLRPMMKSTVDDDELNAVVAGLTGFLTFTACLNDEEWITADATLDLGPRDEATSECLLDELGGPAGVAEALVAAEGPDGPQEFIEAAAKCAALTPSMMDIDSSDSGGSDGFPESDSGDSGDDSYPKGPDLSEDQLLPLAIEDPEALLSELSVPERSCLADRDVGPGQIAQLTGRLPGGSPEAARDIIDCLGDETVLRVFLTTLIGQDGPFSSATSACVREGFAELDLRETLVPDTTGQGPANSLAVGMAALTVSVACMDDEDWAIYAPRLGMDPAERQNGICLLRELGGPGNLIRAMQEGFAGGVPEELTRAAETCGVNEAPQAQ